MSKQQQEEQRKEANQIKPGMAVEATRADIGEKDVSPPKVSEVERDTQGNVEEIVVQKGVLFKKELRVPAERIQRVEEDNNGQTVVIEAGKDEIAALSSAGSEEFPPLEGDKEQEQNLLDEIEETIPTAGGLREKELKTDFEQTSDSSTQEGKTPTSDAATTPSRGKLYNFLHILGPGFLGGMASNDSSAVGSYGSLLGFQVDFVHNLVHLVIGILGLVAAYTGWPRTYNQVFGVIYIVLGILGLIPGLYFANKLLGIVAINGADNVLHLVAGIVLAAVGFFIHDAMNGGIGTTRADNDTMATP